MTPPSDVDIKPVAGETSVSAPKTGAVRRRRRLNLTLRVRLMLLVVASVVPLIGYGALREYVYYKSDRQAIFDGLLTIARGTAVAVERDLQLRVASLEALAVAPALSSDDLGAFDAQAEAYLARLPPGSLLGIVGPDHRVKRMYGLPGHAVNTLPPHEANADGLWVFETRKPLVSDLYLGRFSRVLGFSVDVPVIRDGRVIYDLFARLPASVLGDLIRGQHVTSPTVLALVDSAGVLVARAPNSDRFVGTSIVPSLWSEVRSHQEGVTRAPTLEGAAALAVYTHIAPFGWAMVVGLPEDTAFAPMRSAITHLAVASASILGVCLLLALFAAKGITQPIAQLRALAANNGRIGLADAVTGLPETDMVARALVIAAAERRHAAEALAESEHRFRILFEQSPGGTILVDPDTTRVIESNVVAAASLGYSVAEFRGRPVTDFASRNNLERVREIYRSAGGGQSFSYETRVAGRLGMRDLLLAVAPVRVSGRTLVLVNQIDVTDLRQAEAGLRVNEERLELAREGADLGIWDWDIVNDTLTWSDHGWQLHGFRSDPDGLSSDVWQKAVHPTDLPRVRQELKAALKSSDHPYRTEYSVILPDGSIRRLLARGQVIREPAGRAVRMVGINMDVTARYEAQMARDRLIGLLETERARLVEILDALPIGVGIIDTAGRIVLGNAAMTRLNGPVIQSMTPTPRGEWLGFNADGTRVAAEDYPIRRALRLGETTLPGREFLFRAENGTETWYRVASLPLRREGDQVREVLGIFQDIDAEKRLLGIQQQINAGLEQRVQEEMAAREAAQQRAAHAERMQALGQIAGGIAHDFNNVLQAVSGGAALIERRPSEPDRVLRYARMVLDAAKRGAAITSRLLAFSRRGDLRAEDIDAAALLTDMAEVLTHTLGGSVVCVVEAPPGLPLMFADRGQLETVLVNLAANARDAMPSGGTLTLAADTELVSTGLPHPAGLTPGRYVRLSVSDTGSGMDTTVLARVTEPFFTTKEPGKGTGLGLAMAKGFVEQSGGSLSIDSTVGTGTRITLWMPCVDGAACDGPPPKGAPEPERDKPCVLLVDDDAIVRDVLTMSLEDAGYAVLSADGGDAALKLFDTAERVDIVVSDLTMPGMDGLALIHAMQERRPKLPAVLLTGYAGDGASLAVGGAMSGAFSLLCKPVSGTQLVDRISALLETSEQTRRV